MHAPQLSPRAQLVRHLTALCLLMRLSWVARHRRVSPSYALAVGGQSDGVGGCRRSACVAARAAAVLGTCLPSRTRGRPRLHPPVVAVAFAWRLRAAHRHLLDTLLLSNHDVMLLPPCFPTALTFPRLLPRLHYPSTCTRRQEEGLLPFVLTARAMQPRTPSPSPLQPRAPPLLVLRTPSPRLELCWRATKRAQRSGACGQWSASSAHTHSIVHSVPSTMEQAAKRQDRGDVWEKQHGAPAGGGGAEPEEPFSLLQGACFMSAPWRGARRSGVP